MTRPEHVGLSQPLTGQIAALSDILGGILPAIAGPETADFIDAMTHACRKAAENGDYDALQSRLRQLEPSQVEWLLRANLTWFQLLNAAEKREMARVNRQRMSAETEYGPAPESLEDAVARLKAGGASLDDVKGILQRLDIQPTLTAHPTEIQRRTTRFKLQRIGQLLERLQHSYRTWVDEENALDALRNEVALLLCTDDLRAEMPKVELEVENGLDFLVHSIWNAVPEIYGALRHVARRHYGGDLAVPAFLRFRSWIGGDRDGNPNVTPDVTSWTLMLHRRAALEGHLGELESLREELSLSDRRASVSAELHTSLEADSGYAVLDEGTMKRFRHEPYRLKISAIMARINSNLADRDGDGPSEDYCNADYIEGLELIARSLEQAGLGGSARHGRLQRILWLARTFGFHLAALDIRQDSAVHEQGVAAILTAAGMVSNYSNLPESERQEVLAAAICRPRVLLDNDTKAPEAARNALAVLKVVDHAVAREPDSVGSYVISMTHAVSDVLEVLLLAKEAGLWRGDGGQGSAPIDIVPLFETIEDLAGIEERLTRLFTDRVYRRQLEARGNFQEIMIGYSDSNKDGGYWMASWLLYRAQETIARVSRDHGVTFRLFHGRGGSLERGGGLENEAILAAAPHCHNGRLRFTEQGEVISFRYASVDMAFRHLEQVANAVILATACTAGDDLLSARSMDTFGALADRAMAAYRRFIQKPEFWRWYLQATPIRHIARLPIASRPISRGEDDDIAFEDVRAIPWVFAWRLCRYAVPGWFGLGTALREERITFDEARELYVTDAFFRLIANGAQREMARSRLEIARRYGMFDEFRHEKIHAVISEEFAETRKVLLRISGQIGLLDHDAALRSLITYRNPMIDMLNLLQIELMRRHREARSEERAEIEQLLSLSISSIAAAMEISG